MVRIAVAGAAGRMGRSVIEACQQAGNVRCSVALERPDSTWIGTDAGEVANVGKLNVPVVADLTQVVNEFDVLVDFTRPDATLAHLELCRVAGKRIVIGTTGLTPVQKAEISKALKAGKQIPGAHLEQSTRLVIA